MPSAAPGNVMPRASNIKSTMYGANAVTQTTFPELRTPFHKEKYTRTNTPKTHKAKLGLIGPINSNPLDLCCSNTLRLYYAFFFITF